MRIMHCCIVPALLAGFALVPRVASAQTGALSDILSENITDLSTGAPVPIVFGPPPVIAPIPEDTAEPVLALTMPPRQIDFIEGVGSTQGHISDRLTISQYDVRVQSDLESGLPPGGPGVIRIPASALETFQPIRIEATSDGEFTTTQSDTLTITLGYYGPGTGTVVFSDVIPEPLPEGVTEPVLAFDIPLTLFDIEEPLIETGGVSGIISDYVDILSPVHVEFISSDDLPSSALTNGFVTELETGGGVVYSLNFHSDVVPEPASFALLGVALVAANLFGLRRKLR